MLATIDGCPVQANDHACTGHLPSPQVCRLDGPTAGPRILLMHRVLLMHRGLLMQAVPTYNAQHILEMHSTGHHR